MIQDLGRQRWLTTRADARAGVGLAHRRDIGRVRRV